MNVFLSERWNTGLRDHAREVLEPDEGELEAARRRVGEAQEHREQERQRHEQP